MPAVSPRTPLRTAMSFHALATPSVAARIVASTGLAPPATVYEIGAGDGMLTAALLETGANVIAIERDRQLALGLRQRFGANQRCSVISADALRFPFPDAGNYRLIANPPFAITAGLLRRLTALPNPPVCTALVLQREAAWRWSGIHEESALSVIAKVGFHFEVLLPLRRRDFRPFPSVDCVLLGMRRRLVPLVRRADQHAFGLFVRLGFEGGRGSVRRNLESFLPYHQFRAAAQQARVAVDEAPSRIAADQWVSLFSAVSIDLTRGRRREPWRVQRQRVGGGSHEAKADRPLPLSDERPPG